MFHHTFSDNMSLLNSSSYIDAMTVGQIFSCSKKLKNKRLTEQVVLTIPIFNMRLYLPTSFDDFVIDVCNDHRMDHSNSKQSGQNPLHNIKPDI